MTKRQHFTLEEVLDNVLSDEGLDYVDDPDEPMMEGSNDEFSDLEIDGEIFSDDSEMDTAPSGSNTHTPHTHSTSYDMHSTQGLSAYIHNSTSQNHQPLNKSVQIYVLTALLTHMFFLPLLMFYRPSRLTFNLWSLSKSPSFHVSSLSSHSHYISSLSNHSHYISSLFNHSHFTDRQ